MRGVVWSAGLSVATQAATFLMGLLLARVLGKHAFGEWGMVQNTIVAIAGVAQLSMAVTATKYIAELRHTDKRRIGNILGLCSAVTLGTAAVASAGLLLAAGHVADRVLEAPHLVFAVRVSVGYLFFLTINGFQIGALAGLEAFQALATIGAVSGVIATLLVAGGAFLFGARGAFVAMSAHAAIHWALHHVTLKEHCRTHGIEVRYDDLGSEARVLTAFTLPATLSGLAGSAGIWLSNVALVRSPRGYEEMAVLSAGMSFRSMILFAPNVIARVSMPLLVNLFGNKDLEGYRKAYAKNLWFLSGAALVAAVPVALLAPRLLALYGRSYTDGAATVATLAASAVFEVTGMALYQQIFSSGWMWWGLSTVVLRTALLIGVSSAMAPSQGALGVAIANAAAYAGGLALTFGIVRVKMPSVLGSRGEAEPGASERAPAPLPPADAPGDDPRRGP